MSKFSFVPKKDFNQAVTDTYNDFRVEYAKAIEANGKKKLLRNCEKAVHEVTSALLNRSNKWLLPSVPERLFISHISKDIWFHVYSDKYTDKCHNTVMNEKDRFLRAIRFKLKGTENL